jgi:hypothetical protein
LNFLAASTSASFWMLVNLARLGRLPLRRQRWFLTVERGNWRT